MKFQTFVFTIFLFFLLFLEFYHPISAMSQDLGRHLLTGELILKTHTVPTINLYSYTYPTFPFINHHWFSEVLFFAIFKRYSFEGLFAITIFIVGFAFAIPYWYSAKRSKIPAVAIVSLLYLRVLFERTDVRPEIFSFLFLSCFVTLLYSYRNRFTRLIILLIPLELLWVNMHVYFIIGVAIIWLFFADALLTHRKNPYGKHILFLLCVCLGVTAVTLLNPNGLRGAIYPFHVFENYGYAIEENQNIFFLWGLFSKQTIIYFWVSVGVLFGSLLMQIKRTRPIDWLLALFFTALAITSIRNFPLFVFGTFIPAVYYLHFVLQTMFAKIRQTSARIPIVKLIFYISLLCLLIVQMVQIAEKYPLGFGVIAGSAPAAQFFINNKLKGPILNNFDIGSYLEYRLYPKQRVFVDGRPEAYPVSFFQNTYIPLQEDPKKFAKADKKYHFNTIFFTHTDQTPWAAKFINTIVNNPAWKLVYLDNTTMILLKDNDQNKSVIERYTITQDSYKIPNTLRNMESLLPLTNFFLAAGWQNQAITSLQNLLTIEPNNCNALYILARILSQQQNPTASVFIQRYQNSCK